MTPWLLVDYGDVISRPYDEASSTTIAERLGLETTDFLERYWADRRHFDAGQDASAYWSGVARRPLGEAEVTELVRIDCAGWARLDPEVLELLDEQAAAGTRLALLSNAPHFQADAFDELVWTDRFEQVFVSARLGLVKPDPAIFEHVLSALGATASDVTFVDDRPANVEAARAVGVGAIVFTGAAGLRAALG